MNPSTRSIAVLFAGFVLGSCTETSEPLRAPPESALGPAPPRSAASDNLPRLRTSVEIGERTIVTGSDVPLVLSVTNNEHVPITVPNYPCQLWYVTYDRHGTQVSGGCGGHTGTTDPVTIQPGQSLQIRTHWRAASFYYDNGVIDVPLPPGPYRVHAYFVPGQSHPWDTYLSSPHVVRLVEQGATP